MQTTASIEISGAGNKSVAINAPLAIAGNASVGGTLTTPNLEANTIRAYNNGTMVTVDDNLTIGGNLSVDGFYPIKPYIALYVLGSGSISLSNSFGFMSPTSITLTHATGGLYSFVFNPPHPNGNNYLIFATPRTTSTTTPLYTCTVKVEVDSTAGTKFTVWCRNASNTIVDGDFMVHTLP